MSQPSLDLEYDDGSDPTFGVGELAAAVNQVLRRGFRDGVWVRGEIEGLQQRGGHVYFALAEQTDEGRATIPVALFAPMWMRLRPLLNRYRLRLQNGMAVRIHGSLDYYAPAGRLSLKMDGLDPTFTLGRLAADRDQLLRRLVADGLLDANRSVPIPAVPLRVGVVTSRGSAAWHDVVHELERHRLAFRLLCVDVRVQGQGAAGGVAAAIRLLSRRPVDVIIVVRGGGSRSDLATFDDEGVARAVAASPRPVLTGLGHEVDRSVADEVAHASFKTPTACAAALVERVLSYQAATEAAWAGVRRRAGVLLTRAEDRTGRLARGASRRTAAAVALADQRLTHDQARVRRQATATLAGAGDRVSRAAIRLEQRPGRLVADADRRLAAAASRLGALDPTRTLARGWTITRRPDGQLVRRAGQLAEGDEIVTTFADGTAASRVDRSHS